MAGERQPWSGPCSRAPRLSTRPRLEVVKLNGSSCAPLFAATTGNTRQPISSARATTGRLTLKIQAQPGPLTSRPPSSGPMQRPSAPSVDQVAKAAMRSLAGNNAAVSTCDGASIRAAPTPITTRAAISMLIWAASAPRRDPRPNSPSPTRNTRFCPSRSPSGAAHSSRLTMAIE